MFNEEHTNALIQRKTFAYQAYAGANLGVYVSINHEISYIHAGDTREAIEVGIITYRYNGRDYFIKIKKGYVIENAGVSIERHPIIFFMGCENVVDESGAQVDQPIGLYLGWDGFFQCFSTSGVDSPYSHVCVFLRTASYCIAATVQMDDYGNPSVVHEVTRSPVTNAIYEEFADNSARLIAMQNRETLNVHHNAVTKEVSDRG